MAWSRILATDKHSIREASRRYWAMKQREEKDGEKKRG
jgi:hypothetical protein